VAAAQNFEVGVFGGFAFHSRPYNNRYVIDDKTQPGYVVGAKASLTLPKAQIGLGVEMVNVQEYNYDLPTYSSRIYNNLAKPLITPYLFYNLLHNTPTGGYLYAGIMGGPVVASVGSNTLEYNGPNSTLSGYQTTYNSTLGYILGAQVGFAARVAKRVRICGEFGMRYTNYDYKPVNSTLQDDPYHYRYFYFPVTVGVRYRI